jgi:hypothetical protein
MAATECTSNIPIAIPTAIVSAKLIPNAASFGCAASSFRSFCFIDTRSYEHWMVYKII